MRTKTVRLSDHQSIAVVDLTEPCTITIPSPEEMKPIEPCGFKKIVIRDHSGNAAEHPISVQSQDSSVIDGTSVINENYGCLTLYTNGLVWSDSLERIMIRNKKQKENSMLNEIEKGWHDLYWYCGGFESQELRLQARVRLLSTAARVKIENSKPSKVSVLEESGLHGSPEKDLETDEWIVATIRFLTGVTVRIGPTWRPGKLPGQSVANVFPVEAPVEKKRALKLVDAYSGDFIREAESDYECIVESETYARDLRHRQKFSITDHDVERYTGTRGLENKLSVALRSLRDLSDLASNPSNAVYVRWRRGQEFWLVGVREQPSVENP